MSTSSTKSQAKTFYIWYKHKLCGPFTEEHDSEKAAALWVEMVDGGKLDTLENTDPLHEDMKNSPNVPWFLILQSENVLTKTTVDVVFKHE